MKNFNLLHAVVKNVDFFRDKNDMDKFYVEFKNCNGKTEFTSLTSEKFKGFLFSRAIELSDGEELLAPNDAINAIRHTLNYNQNYRHVDVYVRTAGTLRGGIEYDLQSADLKSVKITSNGWQISEKKKKFVAGRNSLPQVTPIHTCKTPLDTLRPYVNLSGDAYLLFVIWIVQSFSRGNHPILLIVADRGSGKSTLSKMIKKIIDPANFDVTTIPDSKDDLRVLLNGSLVCCLDNASDITTAVSDLFCGAVTGTTMIKRSLYTNDDINVSTLHNILVINGIGVLPKRDDLRERMLMLNLKKLSPNQLKLETDIWEGFENDLPEILGSIFSTLSKAMLELQTMKANNLHRMADSFFEMIAIAKALGVSEEEFRNIHEQNRNALKSACSDSPLVKAVTEFMATVPGRKFTDKATVAYNKICSNFSGDKSLLPGSASHFSRCLYTESEKLDKVGFRAFVDDTKATSSEITILKKR